MINQLPPNDPRYAKVNEGVSKLIAQLVREHPHDMDSAIAVVLNTLCALLVLGGAHEAPEMRELVADIHEAIDMTVVELLRRPEQIRSLLLIVAEELGDL